MSVNERKSWINGEVIGLSLNRFLSDLGHEAGTAILPLFLAALGAPPFALGVIEAFSDGLSSFAKLFAGWLGDRVPRRLPWAALGYALTGVMTGFYALATAWPGVLITRAIGWAGRGLRSPLHDALLTDAVPAEARGRAFGLDEAADTLGAILGPVAALVLIGVFSRVFTTIDAYRAVFWLAAIPGILSAVLLLVLVREKSQVRDKALNFRASLTALPAPFRRYLAGVFMFGIGDYSNTLLILRATQLLTQPLGSEQAGSIAIQLYTLHNILYAAGSYPVGALADRIGKKWLLVGAYLLAAVYNLLLISGSPSLIVLGLIFAMAGSVYASQQSLERAIAADLVPQQIRSTGFGVLATVNGIGDFVSSLVVGAIWTFISPALAFAYSFVLALVGAAAVATALRPSNLPPESG